MNKQTIITAALSICILLPIISKAKSNEINAVPPISVTKFDLSYKIFISYEIRNNSNQDMWICESISHVHDFEVFLDEDSQTLVIRKRLDVPTSYIWRAPPMGKYVRLGPGKKRTESLLISVPVYPINVYTSKKYSYSVAKATRMSIEIGYYVGNLPQMYLDMLQGHENPTDDRSKIQNIRLGAAAGFNRMNESLRRRDDEVRIPYTYQEFKGEKVLATTISDLNILYKETWTEPRYTPPDLTNCNRLEIQYEPSILEYFYPYKSEQNLLNKEEADYLRSQKNVVIETANSISDFANELKQAKQTVGGIVSENSKAKVIGYHDNRRITSFIVYDNTTVQTEINQRIRYFNELQSLRTSGTCPLHSWRLKKAMATPA